MRGKRVTGFTNGEEEAVKLTDVVPFLLEDMLKAKGGNYSKGPDFQPYVVEDGLLITGQNPPSSEPAAEALLRRWRRSRFSLHDQAKQVGPEIAIEPGPQMRQRLGIEPCPGPPPQTGARTERWPHR